MDTTASNRKPELLDTIEQRLVADPKDALALRLLERYVSARDVRTLATLRAWRKANAGLLFFSDVGGYQWFVDENAKRRQGAEATAVGVR